jgi:AraC-like DNA-binding protein
MTSAVVLDFRELPVARDLADDVACVWTRDISPGSSPAVHRVLPDGCIDLIWGARPGSLGVSVAGPDTGPVLASLRPGARVIGLRFRPGRAARFLGVPASEIVDSRPSLDELWGDDAERLAEQLAAAPARAAQRLVLEAAVRERLTTAADPDHLVAAAVRRLATRRAPVAMLARDLGVSERHLLRRCQAAVGYGPKKLDRVLRLGRLLRLAGRHPGAPALPC